MSHFGAGSIPTGDTFDGSLLNDVDKISLIHIYQRHHRGLVGQGHQAGHLLEPVVLDGKLADEVAGLGIVSVKVTVGVVADDVVLIRGDDHTDEGIEGVLELPVLFPAREGSADHPPAVASLLSLARHHDASGLVLIEEDLLNVFLLVLGNVCFL